MQVFGAMGLSPDTPLADGPDEVHLRSVARQEMKAAAEDRTSIGRWMNPGGVS